MRIIVRLNGTNTNPWHQYNLTQNPFPQIARAELMGAMNSLNSLDGEPLQGKEDIAKRLKGWSQDFVELCQEQYKPGERVKFQVEFPDHRGNL